MGAGLANPTHLIFLAILALLLFGAKRLPEIGRSLGTGLNEFKSSVTGLEQHDESSDHMPALLTTQTVTDPTPPIAEPDAAERATVA